MIPPRRCWVEVDGRALRHNVKTLRSLIPKTTKLLGVIKANAYGHGLIPVARELQACGADFLGVANVAEGSALREAGVRLPILLLSATLPEEMAEAVASKLTVTISSLPEGRQLNSVAVKLKKRAQAHFKIDTGMGRLGSWHAEAAEELAHLRRLPRVDLTGLCTHFACADDDATFTRAQWEIVSPFFAENRDLLCHAANSPAVTRRYGFHAGMVRVGLGLYGVLAHESDPSFQLHPILTWKSRVCLLRRVAGGRTVSYGATYRTRSSEVHAVVGMGYGDGYFRAQPNTGDLLVRGQRCPIRGRVTMDQILIDVSRVPDCRVGDEVVVLGGQGGERITAPELALRADTIPWEILTNIGVRVPRVYRHFQTQD